MVRVEGAERPGDAASSRVRGHGEYYRVRVDGEYYRVRVEGEYLQGEGGG